MLQYKFLHREMEASATLIEKLKDPKGKVDPMHKSMLQVRDSQRTAQVWKKMHSNNIP